MEDEWTSLDNESSLKLERDIGNIGIEIVKEKTVQIREKIPQRDRVRKTKERKRGREREREKEKCEKEAAAGR